jgi:putative transposase
MPYRASATQCVVRLIPLRRLWATTLAWCAALRRDAGRGWTDLVAAHQRARPGTLALRARVGAAGDPAGGPAGPYALHSQTVQALAQKLDANLATATELRKREAAHGVVTTAYPHHPKPDQTVVWTDQAIPVLQAGQMRLSNGAKRTPLLLAVPAEYRRADIRQADIRRADIRRAELTWRADHYERCLPLDTGQVPPPPRAGGEVAGVDLGEVHIAAIATTRRRALVISGRHLRACKQGRNRAHAILQEKLSRCRRG